jgi:hypothetical protein
VIATIANGRIRCPACKRQRKVPKRQPSDAETGFTAVKIETQIAPVNISVFTNSNQIIDQDEDFLLAA